MSAEIFLPQHIQDEKKLVCFFLHIISFFLKLEQLLHHFRSTLIIVSKK